MTTQTRNGAWARGANVRLRAKQSQLAVASTFCAAAEKALAVGKLQLAHGAVAKAKQSLIWVRAHLDEPNHVPADLVTGLRQRLAEVEKQLSNLEARL